MNHDFRLDLHRDFSQRIHVAHVRLEESVTSGVANLLQVEPLAAESVEIVEVVHHGQLHPAANQRLRHVGSDKTRASCQ